MAYRIVMLKKVKYLFQKDYADKWQPQDDEDIYEENSNVDNQDGHDTPGGIEGNETVLMAQDSSGDVWMWLDCIN